MFISIMEYKNYEKQYYWVKKLFATFKTTYFRVSGY